MHEIRQFKPALYFLMIVGISGYALSADALGLWVICSFFVLLHAWLSYRGMFRPMPRWMTNLVLLGVLMFVLMDSMTGIGQTPVLMVGQFLVLLQLVKLWEQRTNRDYWQLLVLGLLLMVAAAISTASLWFGLLFLLYLVLSLYCCLLFHLKVDSEAAGAAMALPLHRFNRSTLSQDQRLLSISVWRLAAVGTVMGLIFGVIVFIFFPRGSGGSMLGGWQPHNSQVLVGFSDQVSFQNIARIQQTDETIAWLSLKRNGKPVEGDATVLLRGTTLDTYHGNLFPSRSGKYTWTRTDWDDEQPRRPSDVYDFPVHAHTTFSLENIHRTAQSILARLRQNPAPATQPTDKWEQQITLKPTGTRVLFAMPGPQTISPTSRTLRLSYYISEQVLESREPINDTIEYSVTSTNEVAGPRRPPSIQWLQTRMSYIDPQITAFARRPEVSGTDAQGPLAARRDRFYSQPTVDGLLAAPHPLDEQIARNIEQYLKTHYAYTLDLTDTRQIEGRDPLVAFLYDFKKGHCEYFAGAMTLLCQSLGMQARMVVGFHCEGDSYVNGYYLVQQSHAHAWVEVLTPDGWKTFDPTSAIGAPAKAHSLWQETKNLLNYLDFIYARSVVAYDGENQANLMQRTEQRLLNFIIRSTTFVDPIRRVGIKQWAGDQFERMVGTYTFWTILLRSFVVLMTAALISAIGWFAWERYRLRRRAMRIGLDSLPIDQQMRLARQLGFYDELLRLLSRYRIHRLHHQTPLEFSRSLLFLPADVYDTILRLTQLFYRVRYGNAELTADRRRHLNVVLGRLGEELENRPNA
jgi:transglutaminase-like putative cysteine protease